MNRTTTLLLLGLSFIPQSALTQFVNTIWDSNTDRITDALIRDADGNLYGADYTGDAIYVLSPSGEISTFAEGMNAPNGLAFDSQGNLFVCENIGNHIYTIDPDGIFIDTVNFTNPSGIIKALDSDTMIFTSYGGNSLNKLAPDGTIIETHQGGVLDGPVGLAYDDDGELYVGNFNDRKIYRIVDADLVYVATVPGPSNGALGFIAYGGGVLWGTSFQGHEIYQIEPSYQDSVILYSGGAIGNLDGPIAEATYSGPNGIITNASADSVYISQYPSGEVRLISPGFVGVEDFTKPSLGVYPNPAEEQLTVQIDETMVQIEVMDILGNIIIDQQPSGIQGDLEINLSTLQRGVYFLRVRTSDKNYIVERFLKL